MHVFREAQVQQVLVSILLIWCKVNADVSYRQGMHELLAIVYLVVEKDSVIVTPDISEYV